MNEQSLKKRNITLLIFGSFFLAVSLAITDFFLPFFLKERGLSILEIGAIFSVGLAVGSLIFSLIFSKILKNIRLGSGLSFASFLTLFIPGIMFVIPSSIGAFFSGMMKNMRSVVSMVSHDVSFQHNTNQENLRRVSTYYFLFDALGICFGIALGWFLISRIGFQTSFLVFALIAIIPFVLYLFIKEETRFKSPKGYKLPKTSFKLKLVLFSEIIYWLGLAASFSLVITFLVTDLFESSIKWIAILFMALYFSLSLTSFLTRKIFEKIDMIKVAIFGMGILLLSALLVIFSKNIYWVLAAMLVEGIGAGIWGPAKQALYWKLVGPGQRENVSGYLFGARNFVNILGPVVGGLIVVTWGIIAPFYLKAGIALFSLMVYFYVLKSNKQAK